MSFIISDFFYSFLLQKNIDEKILKKLKKYKKVLSKLAFDDFNQDPVVPEYIKNYVNEIEQQYNISKNNIEYIDWRRDIDIYIDKIDTIINI